MYAKLLVCSTRQDGSNPFEILRWWQLDESTNLNSICWTRTAEGRPLLCAAGSSPRTIIIFDIEYDEPIRTLPGHGRAINDLQISPLSPNILASASEDYSVRIWNLDLKHEKQPCRAILGGQGHKQPLLTLDFHPNGRWLLTGAMDTAVALWAVPPLSELDSANNVEPSVFPYPYFISQEIHTNFVDCVKWYGDCILSRAARNDDDGGDELMRENEILLWMIDGFDASMPHPEHPPIPYPGRYTLSAFPHSERSRGFDRLLTFDTKDTARFYLRFGLLHQPDMRPILVMGNTASKFLFWDLQKCEEGEEVVVAKGKGGRKKAAAKNGISAEGLDRLGGLKKRDGSVASDGASGKSFLRNPSSPTPKLSLTESTQNSFQHQQLNEQLDLRRAGDLHRHHGAEPALRHRRSHAAFEAAADEDPFHDSAAQAQSAYVFWYVAVELESGWEVVGGGGGSGDDGHVSSGGCSLGSFVVWMVEFGLLWRMAVF